ncbi:MAG TPA: amidohydrolase family protein [Terriglobales bacterium]|nr:amidohydrolase family protein [Terriglobales bacterium]
MKSVPTRMVSLAASVAALVLSVTQVFWAAQVSEPASVVETGKFRLHKFEQPNGEETYEISRAGQSLAVRIDFKFTDRATPVPLSASFRSALDLTPLAFEIKGKTARSAEMDQAVEVRPDKIRLRNRTDWKEILPAGGPFFTIAAYAPTTMQMLMVRYWATHGRPDILATIPQGKVRIEPRGQDVISHGGKDEKLDRYMVEGLVWGRETLWFDSKDNLIAAVTLDAEFDHFEAIREGYESALGVFVGRAGADGMAALADLSKTIPGSRAERLALVGGSLIDGSGAAAVPHSTVVIERGRIVAVGRETDVRIPPGTTVVDVRGKTILPGLWDMHAHFEQVEWGPVYLAAGVTTVRDCGNEFEFITAVRDAIANGRGLGPRLLLAGVVDGTSPFSLGVQSVDTPEQARMWTDRYHDARFEQIKIYSSVKLEELKVIIAEAHRLGMTVTGHVPEGLNAYQVVEAGQDQINHVQYVADIMHAPLSPDSGTVASGWRQRAQLVPEIDLNSPEARKAVAFLKAHGTVIDPTIALSELFTATTAKPAASFEPGVNDVAPELVEQIADVGPPTERSQLNERVYEKELAIVGALHRAGIPIVAGTDQAVPGHSLHRELELYVEAGFTPMEAIQAATLVPARVMGLDREAGTIHEGKRADLIVIDGDPLAEIRNTRNVEFTITNGRMYTSADLWRSVGFQPWSAPTGDGKSP